MEFEIPSDYFNDLDSTYGYKKLIEEKGGDVNNIFIIQDEYKYPLFHYTVKCSNLNLVKYLIEEKGADVKATDINGASILHYAVRSSNLELVKYLTEKGADVNATDKDGSSVLHHAVDSEKLDIVKYLTEKGADVNATDKDGSSVLHHVMSVEDSDVLLELLKYLTEKGADANATDKGGRNALDYLEQVWTIDFTKYQILNYLIERIGYSKKHNYFYEISSSLAIAGILNFGSYMKDMLPERMSQAWGGVSNSLAKMQGLETIVNGVSESLGMSAKAANALKANFILALPITITIAAGKAISNFMKARKRRVGVLDATAESLYDIGAIFAQSAAGVAGAAVGAAVIGGTAVPFVVSFGAVYGIGEIAKHAKPVVGKFTSKITSEVSSKLGYSK